MQDISCVAQPFCYLAGPATSGPDPDAGSSGSGEGAVLTGAFADPNGNVTPTDPTKAAWYYQEGGTPNWWQWNVTSQLWNQVAG